MPLKRRSSDLWLPCLVEPGMFRGEYLVRLVGFDRAQPDLPAWVQMLVDEREVECQGMPERKKPASGLVRVSVLRYCKGIAEVVLPQPGQPVGERMLVPLG